MNIFLISHTTSILILSRSYLSLFTFKLQLFNFILIFLVFLAFYTKFVRKQFFIYKVKFDLSGSSTLYRQLNCTQEFQVKNFKEDDIVGVKLMEILSQSIELLK